MPDSTPGFTPIEMLDGRQIPPVGFGTWGLDDDEAASVVETALGAGYRLIDTARTYGNERGVGRGVAAAVADGIGRDEITVTTKLAGADHGYEKTIAGFEASRRRLGLEQVDLYLIHWPLPRLELYVETWKAFIRLQAEGLVKSIGVSNFEPVHIDRIVAETGVWPVVNQIEVHPGFAQRGLVEWHGARGIVTEGWRPLGRQMLENPAVAEIAARHSRTPAQVILRWHLQSAVVAIPKSGDAGRIGQNFDIAGFELDREDMAQMHALEADNRLGGDPVDHEEF